MRRSSLVILSVALAALAGAGCSSSAPHAAATTNHQSINLSGGDNIGRMLHREAPSLTIVSTTPTSANIATVPTDPD